MDAEQAELNTLAVHLEHTVPNLVSVERKKAGFFTKLENVISLKIELEPYAYVLKLHANKKLSPTREKIVRGIRIKTEEITIDQWMKEMTEALDAYAQANKNIRFAIEDFLFFQ